MRKPTSPKQASANRANAKKSTGPRTADGRRTVSLNGLKHGFAGQTCFVPDHEKEAYAQHFKDFRAEYKPKTKTEEFMVQSLAELSWSVQQIRAVINNLMSLIGTGKIPYQTGDPNQDFSLAQAANTVDHAKQLNLLGIYETRKSKLFNTTRKELEDLQSKRKALEAEELEEAAAVRLTSPKTWQPAHNGFACSIEEIDRYIIRHQFRNRLRTELKMAS